MNSQQLQNSFTKKIIENLLKVTKKLAEVEVNTSCPLFAYQPEIPDSVQKLRKFQDEKME